MDKDIKEVRARLLISGRVQGVAFRYYTINMAQSLGINGWVKNCYDGKVEIVMEGEEDKVKELIILLQAQDQELEVVLEGCDCSDSCTGVTAEPEFRWPDPSSTVDAPYIFLRTQDHTKESDERQERFSKDPLHNNP